ncbi:MAG: family transcriptional regulator, cyclic receptor protein [Acidimicrobiaceae bacterium]
MPVTTGFLGALAPTERETLQATGRVARFGKGDVLFRQGDTSDTVVVLLAGWVKAVAGTPEGNEVVLAVRGPGDLVGELAAIDGRDAPRSASVIALQPVECRMLRGEEFRSFVAAHSDAGLVLLRTLTRRLRDADRRRMEYGGYDTARRLARVLVELATEHGRPTAGGLELALALSQQELAGLSAVSRESVARALGKLRSLGLVSTARCRVTVHDPEGLAAFAE